jgi:hypothetical protein
VSSRWGGRRCVCNLATVISRSHPRRKRFAHEIKTVPVTVKNTDIIIGFCEDGAVPLRSRNGSVVPASDADIYVIIRPGQNPVAITREDLAEAIIGSLAQGQLVWHA